ncbi:MAG TPA: non-heme iron oxygenase ferredoxin subunit [bacterium]|nr:non-heme iron oxygenase ferredoxin subunit [bacterium]HEV2440302.1 non-heme iron oxygenase ferredoxin subunit [bacterium]
MAEVKVTQVGQVAPGTGTVVSAEGKAIAVFNVGGTFYAVANECTHLGGPLGQGSLEGTTVTCPWHGSQFDVTSGHVVAGPARRPVAAYRVRVQGDDVFVAVD